MVLPLFQYRKKQNYVFIHINKTGGMGIVKALSLKKKQHFTALEYKNHLGILRWNKSFKFSIVRNPWDKVVSQYFMTKLDWLTDDTGEIMVDFIGRFENLEDSFQTVCKEIGVKVKLPFVNKTEHKQYQCYYDDETKEIVRNSFKIDIERFNYKFNHEKSFWNRVS